jgi:hypothetical protein
MADKKTVRRGLAVATISVGLSAVLALPAQAAKFELTLSGVFNGTGADPTTNPTETITPTGGSANLLTTANEAFTLTGIFDSSSLNLIAGLPFPVNAGWVDFAPLSVTLTVSGTTYNVATYDPSIPMTGGPGLTVAIFDPTTIFSIPPGHYAAGFIQNPLSDGAGIVGDFQSVTQDYTAPNVVATTYTNYYGVGFGSGPCPMGNMGGVCLPLNNPPPNAVVPIPLDGGLYELTLGTYDLENPSNGVPTDPNGTPPNFANDNFFSASLTAVPEPSTWALLLAGFVALGCLGLYRGKKTPLSA